MKQNRINKDKYFIEIAKLVAQRSTCLSRKVGCVLVDSNSNILATGYNGPPRGQGHCFSCIRKETNDIHKCRAVHAEQNALLQCADISKIHRAYITDSPCNTCMKMFLNTNIEEIIYINEYHNETEYLKSQYNFTIKLRRYIDEKDNVTVNAACYSGACNISRNV